jgi:two-component system, cell cycle response regulator
VTAERVLVTAGAAGTAVHVALPLAGAGDWSGGLVLHNGLCVLAVVIAWLAAVRRPHERGIWALLALGITSYTVGETYYAIVLPDGASLADVFYLGAYPFVWAAFVWLIRSRITRSRPEMWLDGLTSTLALASIGSAAAHALLASAPTGGLAVTINLACGLLDVSLIALACAAMAACGGTRDRTFLTLTAGLTLFAAADLTYLVQATNDSYVVGGLLDPTWSGGLLLMAFAAWQRGSRILPVDDSRRLAFPVVFGIVSIALLATDHWSRLPDYAVLLAAAALVAVVARLVITFADKQQANRALREQTLTDVLTGLGNRRRLLLDLEGAALRGARLRVVIFDLDGFKAYNDTFGHPAGDALLRRLGRRLEEALAGRAVAYRLGGDEFCLVAPAGDSEGVVDLAMSALSEVHEGVRVSATWGGATLGVEGATPGETLGLADKRMYSGKRSGRATVQEQVRDVLLTALHARLPGIEHGAAPVRDWARALAIEVGLSVDEVEDVTHAAALHDIGKLALSDAILGKPGSLDDREWWSVEQHAAIGERILRAAPAMSRVAQTIRATHERFDGEGYPDGLAGEEIPIGARIIAVADAYSAMTGHRPHAAPRSPAEAQAELRRCAGTQFDPAIVAAFERLASVECDAQATAA